MGEIISETDNLSTFKRLLEAAGLINADGEGRNVHTVFGPTNAAFEALATETQLDVVECLLSSPETLKHFLLYHVTSGVEYTSILALRDTIATKSCHRHLRKYCYYGHCYFSYYYIHCQELTIEIGDEGILIGSGGIPIETANIPASNSVIHTIPLPLSNPTIDLAEVCADFPLMTNN